LPLQYFLELTLPLILPVITPLQLLEIHQKSLQCIHIAAESQNIFIQPDNGEKVVIADL